MYSKNEVFQRYWNLVLTPLSREEVVRLLNEIDNDRDLLTAGELSVLYVALQTYASARCIDVCGIPFF